MLTLRGRVANGVLAARAVRCSRCPAVSSSADSRIQQAIAERRAYGPMGAGARHLSFFSELKKSFQKEVEQNKEFRESLNKLKKDTDQLTGKAQEESSKISEEAKKYASDVTSKFSEASEKLSSSFADLRSRFTPPAKAEEEVAKPAARAARAEAKKRAAEAEQTVKMEEEAAAPPKREEARRARASEEAAAKDEATAKASSQAAGEEAAGEGTAKATAEEASAGAKEGAEQTAPPEPASKWFAYDAASGLRVMGKPWRMVVSEGRTELKEAWDDLFGLKEQTPASGMRKQLYKPAPEPAAGEGEEAAEGKPKEEVKGGGALMIVKDQGNTWQRLTEKLRDAPIIQEILKAGSKLADTELGRQAQKLRTGLKDRVEDVREVWETSQNPLVYRLSSMWDDLTSETELGIALREIRRADPEFVLEDWLKDISENFLPSFFESYLRGDLKSLQPYLSEGMYRSLAEEFRLRKAEGLALDPHVLEIGNTEVIQAKMHDHQPVLMVGTLFQHINCVRDREGKIVEGTEDEVRASFYLLLFAREFNEEEGALVWKITERYLAFSEKYI